MIKSVKRKENSYSENLKIRWNTRPTSDFLILRDSENVILIWKTDKTDEKQMCIPCFAFKTIIDIIYFLYICIIMIICQTD